VRQWVAIDVSMEFRGFVNNGRLNALSQYNHLCYFPELRRHRDRIGASISRFFNESISPCLSGHFESYVIDFAMTGFDESRPGVERLWVIELNPFMETTDGCLFSWQHERHLLEGGAEGGSEGSAPSADDGPSMPPHFRVCGAPRNGAKALVANDWRALLEGTGEDWAVSNVTRGESCLEADGAAE
jgi:hypothetical protein